MCCMLVLHALHDGLHACAACVLQVLPPEDIAHAVAKSVPNQVSCSLASSPAPSPTDPVPRSQMLMHAREI